MATLGEIRDKLRTRVLNVSSVSYYDPDDLLGMVEDASREVASSFRFPTALSEVGLLAGAITASLPVGGVDLLGLTAGGLALTPRAWPYVKFLQGLPATAWPRGYFFDMSQRKVHGFRVAEFGPPLLADITFGIRYVADPYFGITLTDTTDVWLGEHEAYHELVLLRAAVKAFEMKFELEDAGYYLGRYGLVLKEFAQYLGMAVPEVLAPPKGGG